MKKGLIVVLLACLVLVGCENFKGPAGAIGPKGDNGATGPQGQKGDKGDSVVKVKYDGVINSSTIYVHYDGITTDTVAEVYLCTYNYDNWMAIGGSGIAWYYIDVNGQNIVIKDAYYAGWNKYRVFIY